MEFFFSLNGWGPATTILSHYIFNVWVPGTRIDFDGVMGLVDIEHALYQNTEDHWNYPCGWNLWYPCEVDQGECWGYTSSGGTQYYLHQLPDNTIQWTYIRESSLEIWGDERGPMGLSVDILEFREDYRYWEWLGFIQDYSYMADITGYEAFFEHMYPAPHRKALWTTPTRKGRRGSQKPHGKTLADKRKGRR